MASAAKGRVPAAIPRLFALGLAFLAVTLSSPREAHPAQRKMTTGAGAGTGWGGQRNVISIPGMGYWAFFKSANPDRLTLRYSGDGMDWTAAEDVFPYLQMAPDAAAGYASVWLRDEGAQKYIYIAAPDAGLDYWGSANRKATTPDWTDGNGNKVFLRMGKLNPTNAACAAGETSLGRLCMGPIVSQRSTFGLAKGLCQYVPPKTKDTIHDWISLHTVSVSYASSTTGGFVSLFAAGRGLEINSGIMSAHGVLNLAPDLSGYNNGVWKMFGDCVDHDNSQIPFFDATLDETSTPVLVPVRESPTVSKVLLADRIPNADALSVAATGLHILRLTENSVNLTPDGTELGTLNGTARISVLGDNNYGNAGLNEEGSGNAHFAYIGNQGQLVYWRRAVNGTGLVTGTLNGSGAAGGTLASIPGAPLGHPSVSLVSGAPGGATYVYVVYADTTGIHFDYTASTNTVFNASTVKHMTNWRLGKTLGVPGTGNLGSADYPKLGLWTQYPQPLPVIWTDGNDVFFDKIITSTFPAVTATHVTTVPASAYLTGPAYDLIVTGANLGYGVTGGTKPWFRVLRASETQSEVRVASVTYVSDTQLRVSVVLSTSVFAGFDYDMRVEMPDGQEYPARFDRGIGSASNVPFSVKIPSPTLVTVSDPEGGASFSGGSVYSNNGTQGNSRALTLTGADFMNWSGSGASSVVPSSNTLSVDFLRASDGLPEPEVSVASLAYAGSATATLYARISTAAYAGLYQLRVRNPAGGSALSLPNTFYVTAPTATLAYPGAGNNVGFQVILGSAAFNNFGQTSVSGAKVRITHAASGRFWNGSAMQNGLNLGQTEEDKWRPVTSIGAKTDLGLSTFTYAFDAANTVAVPDDGPYELAVRGETQDGGVGDPYTTAFGTVAVVFDRFDPSIALVEPVAGATNAAAAVRFSFTDNGSGLNVTRLLVQDITADPNSTVTWRSFGVEGSLGVANDQIWLSMSSTGTPQTVFSPPFVGPRTITIGAGTTLKLPQWQNGRKYRVFGYAADDAGRVVDQSTSSLNGGVTFLYDVQRPTLALTSPSGLATTKAAATWLTSFSQLAGTIRDNVADSLDAQHIYLRVGELVDADDSPDRWLDPNSTPLILTNAITPAQAWKSILYSPALADTAESFPSWDVSAAAFVDGLIYKIEAYASDSAGNSTGTAATPLFTYYLRLDRTAPILSQVALSTQGQTAAGDVLRATTSFVGLWVSSNPLASVRFCLGDGSGSGLGYARYSLRYNGASGTNHWDPLSPSSWTTGGQVWNTAQSTTALPYAVALASAVEWREGKDYYMVFEATDVAGNLTQFTWNFILDYSNPQMTALNITSGTTFGGSVVSLPSSISGTVRDKPEGGGLFNADVQDVHFGIRRQSDGKWYREDIGPTTPPDNCAANGRNWGDVRIDPLDGPPFTGNAWTYPLADVGDAFWNNRSTETYYVYTWTQDNVPLPYKNITSSFTLAAVFQWEVQKPSSSLVFPLHDVWYSSHPGYALDLIRSTASDAPTAGVGMGSDENCDGVPADGFRNVCAGEVEIQDTDVSGLCWSGAAFSTNCDTIGSPTNPAWRAMSVQNSSFTYDTDHDQPSGGLWNSLVTGQRYRVRVRAKDSAKDAAFNPAPNTEQPPDIALGGWNAQIHNVRYFRVDKTAPTTQLTVPTPNNSVTAVPAIQGTANDAHRGVGKTFIAVCRDNGAGGPDLAACLTSLAGTFVGAAKFFEPSMSGSDPTKDWTLDTSGVASGAPGWEAGRDYYVIAYSSDAVDNTAAYVQAKFSFVQSDVTSAISAPSANDVFYRSAAGVNRLTVINGTASTITSNVRVQITVSTGDVRFADDVLDLDDNLCWNGAAWLKCSGNAYSAAASTYVVVPAIAGTPKIRRYRTEPPGQGPGPGRGGRPDVDPDLRHRVGLAPGRRGIGLGRLGADGQVPGRVRHRWPDGLQSERREVRRRGRRRRYARRTERRQLHHGPGRHLKRLRLAPGLQIPGQADRQGRCPEQRGRHRRAVPLRHPYPHGDDDGAFRRHQHDVLLGAHHRIGRRPRPQPCRERRQRHQPFGHRPRADLERRPGLHPGPERLRQRQVLYRRLRAFLHVNWDNVSQATWSYTSANLASALGDGVFYMVRARGRDRAGNIQGVWSTVNSSSMTIAFDKTPPQAWLTFPGTGNPATGMTSQEAAYTPAGVNASGIVGTAADGPVATAAGFKVVSDDDVDIELSYLQAGASQYWVSGAWSATPGVTPVGVTGGTNWSFNTAGVTWVSDKQYTVRARTRDKAVNSSGGDLRNLSVFMSTITFVVDNTVPVASTTWPLDGRFLNAVSSITGTANGDLAGVSRVDVRLQRVGGGADEDWTGSSWTALNDHWIPTSLSGVNGVIDWSTTTFIAGAFANDQRYAVHLRVTDRAGNVRNPSGAGGDVAFTYDNVAPTLSFKKPYPAPALAFYGNGANANVDWELHRTSGVVADAGTFASGVSEVWVAIASGPAAAPSWDWWNETSETFPAAPNNQIQWTTQVYTSGGDWNYVPANAFNGPLTSNAVYRIFIKARDRAGNWVNNVTTPGSSGAGQTLEFVYDAIRPTTTVTSPAQGAVVKTLASLGGVANDGGGSGIRAVYLAIQDTSDEPLFRWWNWGPGGFTVANPISWPEGGGAPDLAGSGWAWVATTSVQGAAVYSVPWTTAVPNGLLTSSHTYRVVTAAWDWTTTKTDNPILAGSGNAFRFDNQAPVVVSTFPRNSGDSYNAAGLSALAGTAQDLVTGNSGVSTVQVLLKNDILNSYWTGAGSTFEAPPAGFDNWVTVSALAVGATTQWSRAWPTLNDNTRYVLWQRATDLAVNVSTYPNTPVDDARLNANQYADGTPAKTFTYDNSPPVSMTTKPSAAYLKDASSLASITGTAYTDVSQTPTGAMVDQVLLNLWCSGCAPGNAAGWWGGTSWSAGAEPVPPLFSAAFSAPVWQQSFTNAWPDGYQFKVYSRAHDVAGNDEAPEALTTFVMDRTTPVAKVAFPASGGFAGSGPVSISGTANDRFCDLVDEVQTPNPLCVAGARDFQSGIKASSVVVSLEDYTTAATCNGSVRINRCWWNGTLWVDQTAAIFSTATFVGDSSGTWTYAVPPGALIDLRDYKVSAFAARDAAGNVQRNVTTNTFSSDFSAPISTITVPVHGSSPEALPQITGTASDVGAAGMNRVYVAYYRVASSKWFNSSNKLFDLDDPLPTPSANPSYWVQPSTNNGAPVQWVATGASTPTFVSGTIYQVVAIAEDKGLNLEAIPGTVNGRNRIQFTFTEPTPRSEITAPVENQFLQSAAITVTGTANDPSIIEEVRVKDIGDPSNVRTWDPTPVTGGWKPVGTYNSFSSLGVNFTDNGPGFTNGWSIAAASLSNSTWTYFGPFRRLQIEAQGRSATLTEAPAQVRVFYVDTVAPLAEITAPAALFANSVSELAGTASDNAASSGSVTTAYFRLKRNDNGQYLNWVSSAYVVSALNCVSAVDATCGQSFSETGNYSFFHGSLTNSGAFVPNILYTAELIVKDSAVNSVAKTKSFRWDISASTAGIVQPTASNPVNTLTSITGTASDFWSMGKSSVSLRSVQKDLCYDGGGSFNRPCPYWLATSSDVSANWTYFDALLNTTLRSANTWYTVLAKAIDTAGNEPAGYVAGVSSRTFLVDSVPPSVALTFPADGAAYKRVNVSGAGHELSGTAVDPGAPWNSGIRSVDVRISYLQGGDSYYYLPGPQAFSSGTIAAPGWFNSGAVVFTPWTHDLAVQWASGDRQYQIDVRGQDLSFAGDGAATGNLSAPAVPSVDIRTFFVDDTAPTFAVQSPAAPEVNALATISGTANADLAGLSEVAVRIQRIAGGADEDWTGSSWTALNDHYSTATLSGVTGMVNWDYDDLAGAFEDNRQYRVYVRLTDRAGNVRSAPGGGDYDFKFDTTPPTLDVRFPFAPPNVPPFSHNSESARSVTIASGAVADSWAGVSEVWVAVSSGSSRDVWYDHLTGRFDHAPDVNVFWTTQAWSGGGAR
ncbi:MAG: hypothetical protein FD129_6 [bacterium]|nr:MAG: hypothetical protein FD129_6 [bacterium]